MNYTCSTAAGKVSVSISVAVDSQVPEANRETFDKIVEAVMQLAAATVIGSISTALLRIELTMESLFTELGAHKPKE